MSTTNLVGDSPDWQNFNAPLSALIASGSIIWAGAEQYVDIGNIGPWSGIRVTLIPTVGKTQVAFIWASDDTFATIIGSQTITLDRGMKDWGQLSLPCLSGFLRVALTNADANGSEFGYYIYGEAGVTKASTVPVEPLLTNVADVTVPAGGSVNEYCNYLHLGQVYVFAFSGTVAAELRVYVLSEGLTYLEIAAVTLSDAGESLVLPSTMAPMLMLLSNGGSSDAQAWVTTVPYVL